MPLVDLDQDVLDFIRSHVRDFGETPSSVLKRLLNIQTSAPDRATPIPTNPKPVMTPVHVNQESTRSFEDRRQRSYYEGTAISRYFEILSELYREDPARFQRVEQVRGRKRIYFSKSSTMIEASGSSVMPERIPDTQYFAATNLSDDKKKRILEEVLMKLGIGFSARSAYLKRLDPRHSEDAISPSGDDLDDMI